MLIRRPKSNLSQHMLIVVVVKLALLALLGWLFAGPHRVKLDEGAVATQITNIPSTSDQGLPP